MSSTEEFIKGLFENDHVFVSEVLENAEKKVVGAAGLHVNKNPRLKHSAVVWIMIHPEYQGKGIGTALLKKIIDLADNWLMLVRLELNVFVENERAVKLYQALEFQIEEIKRYVAVRNGKYADQYLTARYKI